MMFSLPTTAATMLQRIHHYQEGDVIICNGPYSGGQHLLDVQLFSPVVIDDRVVAFVANIAHHLDMGGTAPGAVAGGLMEIYQEGLRIPLVKLYRQGREDHQIFDLIACNIRIPEKTMEDLRAQAATTFVGTKRVKALVEKYGLDVFQHCSQMLLDYSQQKVRRFISALPDGDFTGIDYLDDDGQVDEPVKVQVNVHVSNDTMTVDFDGSSPQTKGNVNSPWACCQGGVYYTMVGILDPHMPLNSGTFKPITVKSRQGLVTNPLPPAGVTARSQTMTKITEAMLKAMSVVVPDRIVAGSHGQACTNSFSGIHPQTGRRFGYIEIQGGRPAACGRFA
jgi:N-methylhydantoinase B